MTFGITGASGELGRLATAALLERVDPRDVVLITRDPSKLADAADRGVRVRRCDFGYPSTFGEAFAGIDRLLLISTNVIGARVPQQRAAIEAAARTGVGHVLYTSIVNPVAENPAVVAEDHRQTEEALRASGVEWTFLRNSIYAELQLPIAAQAIASGRLVHNNGAGAVSYVSREDCAAAAAGALAGAARAGRAYDITGPAALTAADVAALAGELSGRTVEPMAVDDDAYAEGLVEHAGLPEPLARAYATFGTSAREGFADTVSDAAEELSGRPPRSLRDVLAARSHELVPAAA